MAPFYDSTVVQDLIIDELDRRGRGSQTRLAEAVGVRVQTVNKWVKRQTSPEPDKWPAIERHFEWNDGMIAGRAVRPGPPDEVEALKARVAELEAALGGRTQTQTGTVDKPPATGGFDPDE